jgi:hypothetical protein
VHLTLRASAALRCGEPPNRLEEGDSMIRRIAVACVAVLACASTAPVGAAPEPAKPIVGTWQGTLPNGMGGQIRVVLHVSEAEGALKATMDSPDQGATGIPVAKVGFENQKLTLDVAAVSGSYEGTLDAAKGEVSGTWKQSGQELALVFKKYATAK